MQRYFDIRFLYAALIGALPHLATLWRRGFYSDDYFFMLRAESMSWGAMMLDNLEVFGGLRPLGYLYSVVPYKLFADTPWMHQLFGVFELALLAILLGVLTWQLTGCLRASTLAVLFYMLMPIHAEAVYWTLCTVVRLGVMLAMLSAIVFILAVRTSSWSKLALACFIYALSILVYEQTLAWVWLWPIIAYIALGAWGRRLFAYCIPMMLTAIMIAGVVMLFSHDSDRQSSPVLEVAHVVSGFIHLIDKALINDVWLVFSGVRSFHIQVVLSWLSENKEALLCVFVFVASCAYFVKKQVRSISKTQGKSHPIAMIVLVAGLILLPLSILALAPRPVIEPRHYLLVSVGAGVGFAFIAQCLRSFRLNTFLLLGVLVVMGFVVSTRSESWARSWDEQQKLGSAIGQELEKQANVTVMVIKNPPYMYDQHAIGLHNFHGLYFFSKWYTNQTELFVGDAVFKQDNDIYVGRENSRKARVPANGFLKYAWDGSDLNIIE